MNSLVNMILSIDQGTTGTTALLIDQNLTIKDKVTVDFRQIFPKPGWVEHDLNDIWSSVEKAISVLLKRTKTEPKKISAIGITNQRETTCVWDKKTGKPLHHAIVWQCKRTTSLCESLKNKGLNPLFKEKTGLLLDPYFSGTKMAWLLENVSEVKTNLNAVFGTIDSYLISKLSNQQLHITDASNASRTLLMNLETLSWDDELCAILEIPVEKLPLIKSNAEVYGKTKGLSILPDGIPIASSIGDQQAALFGQSCFEKGESKCTYGTGSFILMNIGQTPTLSKHGLLTTVAWKYPMTAAPIYALEGSNFIAGAVVQWLRDGLCLIKNSSEIEVLAQSVFSSDGVVFVPALSGLGAPYWNPESLGLIYGLTRGTTKAHIARAALEGIAFENYDLVKTMEEDAGCALKTLKVDGGASSNNLLMQFQADILNTQLQRPANIETTALGAAFLAGLAVGFWSDLSDIKKKGKVDKTFTPSMDNSERTIHLKRWKKAIKKVLS
ncbi:MAG: glycerol kinase GlpK [Deltaproteobacteria bacterium]|nr:glycerol kinase GlpK [Deltaproteobacteria bacterium]